MARKKDPRRWLLEAWEYAQMTPEEEIERIQAALKVLETPEQKRQREEAKRRRALAKKIGLTPEEFDARVREFERKFFRDQE
jgi:tripartite-type tricarboxylate transporter receptor subunit TctC